MSAPIPSPRRAGFSLVELLIAMVVLGLVMGAAVMVLRSQTRTFARGADDTELFQTLEFATGSVARALRTMGANIVGDQPMLVYGGPNVIAFNADYTERTVAPIRWAVNYNPDAPEAEVNAWDVGQAGPIPTQTAYTYPSQTYRLRNGTESPAETIVFYLEPDGTTARGDDFVLYQRVNAAAAQVVARNVLAMPGRPVFEYFLRRAAGPQPATGAELPLIRRSLAGALTAADSATRVLPDSVRAIRFNLRVTNGRAGADERIRSMATLVDLPNNGLPQPTVCGRTPMVPANLIVVPGAPGSGEVVVQWSRSPDHGAGENDVLQYAVYQRSAAVATWSEPLFSVRADTTTQYAVTLAGLTPTQSYTFGVAAQDCTPAFSSIVQRTELIP